MTPRIYRSEETRYTHEYHGEKLVTIWSNPDVPSIASVIANEAPDRFVCPNPEDPRQTDPDGCTAEFEVNVDASDPDALDEFIDHMGQPRVGGTVTCPDCGEPVYGLIAEPDEEDLSGWLE